MKKYLILFLPLFLVGCETPTSEKTSDFQNVSKITKDVNQTADKAAERVSFNHQTYDAEFIKKKEECLAHTRKGGFLMLEGKFGQAKREFINALEYDPNNAEVLRLAAEAALSEPDLDLAVDLFEKTVSIDPLDFRAYWNLGITYYLLDDYEKSKGAFLKVLDIDPENITAAASLAEIYYKQNDYERCLKNIDLFKEIYYKTNLDSLPPLIREDLEKRKEVLRVYKEIVERKIEDKKKPQL
ncbi:MAG: tetratricopeptide repeat protein [candidate division Zixibacteria bacterium]|nr:tetratricopeptide repeat protein [candidate division Zixibacteria bacterium]